MHTIKAFFIFCIFIPVLFGCAHQKEMVTNVPEPPKGFVESVEEVFEEMLPEEKEVPNWKYNAKSDIWHKTIGNGDEEAFIVLRQVVGITDYNKRWFEVKMAVKCPSVEEGSEIKTEAYEVLIWSVGKKEGVKRSCEDKSYSVEIPENLENELTPLPKAVIDSIKQQLLLEYDMLET